MPNIRRVLSIMLLALVSLPAFHSLHAQQTSQEAAVWKLETAYWEYVKAGDMNTFLTLWHPDFVGWPALADKPRRKDSIAATYTALYARGEHLGSYTIKRADSQRTGNLVVTHYWANAVWTDTAGKNQTWNIRVTHTWLQVGRTWQIISGMAANVDSIPN